jgi:hypothetical protein
MSAVAHEGARILAAYVILTAGASWQGKMDLWKRGCVGGVGGWLVRGA